MNLKGVAGYLTIGALFAIILVWGFAPRYESWYGLSLLALSGVSLILWVVMSLDVITKWLKMRSTQYYISLAITAVMSLAILSVINWAAVKYNKKWDLTLNQIHTLSDQSKKIVSELKEGVTIRVWTTALDRISPNIDMKKFLDNYRMASKGNVKIEVLSPNEDPVQAKTDNVKRDNLFIIRAASGRESRIDNFSDSKGEEQVTNAIVQTIKGSKKTICFLAGHNELSLTDTTPAGLSQIRDRINDSSYAAKEITLLANAEGVPPDCEALAIVGPKGDIPESELVPIQNFLNKGGKLLAAFGPGTQDGWKKLVAAYGVEVQDDFVLEPRSPRPDIVITRNFSRDTEITKNSSAIVYFLESSSLKLPTASTFNGASVKTFVSTEASAIAKSGLLKGKADMAPRSTDRKGPLPIGALVSKAVEAEVPASPTPNLRIVPSRPGAHPGTPPAKATPPGTKVELPKKSGSLWKFFESPAYAQEGDDGEGEAQDLMNGKPPAAPVTKDGLKDVKKETDIVVFSSAYFAANGVVKNGGNMDLFLNSISYLMKDQDLIGIRPRDMKGATLELTNRSTRQVYATIFFLSALFFFFAILAVKRKFVRS